MTGRLPLTITDLLIQCTPAPGATNNKDATAMTPAHKHQPAFGDQQDAILILGHIARGAPPALGTQLFERALEVLSEGYLVGGALRAPVPSPQVDFRGVRSGSCVRKAEVEGRLEDRALVVRVDVVGPIWERPA